jgi:hypothetical protein
MVQQLQKNQGLSQFVQKEKKQRVRGPIVQKLMLKWRWTAVRKELPYFDQMATEQELTVQKEQKLMG